MEFEMRLQTCAMIIAMYICMSDQTFVNELQPAKENEKIQI